MRWAFDYRVSETIATFVLSHLPDPRGLHVAHASELKLEVDAVGLALGIELGDVSAQPLGRLGVLGGLCHLHLLDAMFITDHVSHLSYRGRQRVRPLNLQQG